MGIWKIIKRYRAYPGRTPGSGRNRRSAGRGLAKATLMAREIMTRILEEETQGSGAESPFRDAVSIAGTKTLTKSKLERKRGCLAHASLSITEGS